MSTDDPTARPAARWATIAVGTALVLLTVAILAAMHLLGGRLVPGTGDRAHAASERAVGVPPAEIGRVDLPGEQIPPATMGS